MPEKIIVKKRPQGGPLPPGPDIGLPKIGNGSHAGSCRNQLRISDLERPFPPLMPDRLTMRTDEVDLPQGNPRLTAQSDHRPGKQFPQFLIEPSHLFLLTARGWGDRQNPFLKCRGDRGGLEGDNRNFFTRETNEGGVNTVSRCAGHQSNRKGHNGGHSQASPMPLLF